MEQKTDKQVTYDAETKKFLIRVENRKEITSPDSKTVWADHKDVVEQAWNKVGLEEVKRQLESEQTRFSTAIEDTKSKIKEIPIFGERELQNLKKFRENLERTQELQKLDKLKETLKSQEGSFKKISEDVEDIKRVLSQAGKSE